MFLVRAALFGIFVLLSATECVKPVNALLVISRLKAQTLRSGISGRYGLAKKTDREGGGYGAFDIDIVTLGNGPKGTQWLPCNGV
jgi:hypothetical protein